MTISAGRVARAEGRITAAGHDRIEQVGRDACCEHNSKNNDGLVLDSAPELLLSKIKILAFLSFSNTPVL